MLNPIEKFKVAILHLNRDWNHCDFMCNSKLLCYQHGPELRERNEPISHSEKNVCVH